MRDVLFAALGLIGFALFCGVLVWFVPQGDLVVVTIIVLLMAAYDFVRELILHRHDN